MPKTTTQWKENKKEKNRVLSEYDDGREYYGMESSTGLKMMTTIKKSRSTGRRHTHVPLLHLIQQLGILSSCSLSLENTLCVRNHLFCMDPHGSDGVCC